MRVYYKADSVNVGHKDRGIGFHNASLIRALSERCKSEGIGLSYEKEPVSYDILHIPFVNLFSRPEQVNNPSKTVVTIHDVIPLIYPKRYPIGIRGNINLYAQKRFLEKVHGVITVSETSKKDIVRLLGVESNKVHVVYNGPGNSISPTVVSARRVEAVLSKYNLPNKYVLYVGDVNWNKNLVNLVKAIKHLNTPLVIVGTSAAKIEQSLTASTITGPKDILRKVTGGTHPHLVHLKELLTEIQATDLVHRLGFVPEDEIGIIWRNALCYCQPSWYEGFGMALLESFWAGVPVVASRTQALVEVGDNAVWYVNPASHTDIAEGIAKVLSDPQLARKLVNQAVTRRKLFTWERAAAAIVEIYKHIG